MAFSVSNALPAVDAPKSTAGLIYGAGVPLALGYIVFERGMPEDATEWALAIVLLLVAVGFAMNLVSVQIKSAPPAA